MIYLVLMDGIGDKSHLMWMLVMGCGVWVILKVKIFVWAGRIDFEVVGRLVAEKMVLECWWEELWDLRLFLLLGGWYFCGCFISG